MSVNAKTNSDDDAIGNIPKPAIIRQQLSDRLKEARILRRLLKVSEAAADRSQRSEGDEK